MTVRARRLRLRAAVVAFSQGANGVKIGLFVQKPTRVAAFHTKSYVSDIKFVKMLESSRVVSYNIFTIGGNDYDF